MSVSVLLDQHVRWEGRGKQAKAIFVPPSPEALKAVHDVIAGLTGFSEERGDQLMIESLPFEATALQAPPDAGIPPNTPVTQQLTSWRDSPRMLMMVGGAIAVVLILALGVFFYLRKRKKKAVRATVESENTIEGADEAPVLTGATGAEKIKAALAERQAEQESADLSALASIKLPVVTTKKSEVLVAQLRESGKKDAIVQAQVLQTWIRGNE